MDHQTAIPTPPLTYWRTLLYVLTDEDRDVALRGLRAFGAATQVPAVSAGT